MSSCYKDGLYVQQEWVDASFLASSKVQTPDPRQADPPVGQRLIVAWDFPKSLFQEGLSLVVTVRLWDNSQSVFEEPLVRKRDVTAFFFPNKQEAQDKHILTYRIQVFNAQGQEVRLWEHQLWTELIQLHTD